MIPQLDVTPFRSNRNGIGVQLNSGLLSKEKVAPTFTGAYDKKNSTSHS